VQLITLSELMKIPELGRGLAVQLTQEIPVSIILAALLIPEALRRELLTAGGWMQLIPAAGVQRL
jgi:hypothetical protein